MRLRRRGLGTAALLSALALLGGCGYTLGFRAPPGVVTVAVPIFDNQTLPLRREIEYELTSAVRSSLQSRTELRLIDSEDADLIVYGTVRDLRERVLAEDRIDRVTESSLTIQVELLIEDHRNRRSWRESIHDTEPVSAAIGESLQTARRRAIGNLADKIVTVLDAWDDD